MLTNDKALVERLRSGRWLGETTCGPAADRIEAQAAEIERLREALEHIENYYGDGHRITELARAALGERE